MCCADLWCVLSLCMVFLAWVIHGMTWGYLGLLTPPLTVAFTCVVTFMITLLRNAKERVQELAVEDDRMPPAAFAEDFLPVSTLVAELYCMFKARTGFFRCMAYVDDNEFYNRRETQRDKLLVWSNLHEGVYMESFRFSLCNVLVTVEPELLPCGDRAALVHFPFTPRLLDRLKKERQSTVFLGDGYSWCYHVEFSALYCQRDNLFFEFFGSYDRALISLFFHVARVLVPDEDWVMPERIRRAAIECPFE